MTERFQRSIESTSELIAPWLENATFEGLTIAQKAARIEFTNYSQDEGSPRPRQIVLSFFLPGWLGDWQEWECTVSNLAKEHSLDGTTCSWAHLAAQLVSLRQTSIKRAWLEGNAQLNLEFESGAIIHIPSVSSPRFTDTWKLMASFAAPQTIDTVVADSDGTCRY